MEQSFLFDLGPAVDAVQSNLRNAVDTMENAKIDADLPTFRQILERLQDWRAGVDDTSDDSPDMSTFDTIVSDLEDHILDHANAQTRAQEAMGECSGGASEALEWADTLADRFADAEFDALWAEVDYARAMVRPPFNPALDCPACHRASMGADATGVSHDRDCPNRPAWKAKCGPCASGAEVDVRQHAPSCPVRVQAESSTVWRRAAANVLDPATGLPRAPRSRGAVMDDLDRLTAGRPAHVPCTRCRTGRGERHGRGCPNVARRSA